MRIAVLVSYHNRPDLLALCLKSLSIQTRPADQIILCDDCSDIPAPRDTLLPIVDLVVRRNVHPWFGKERVVNRALLEINCDYVILVDQDGVFPKNWLAKHEKLAKRDQYVCSMYTHLNQEESKLVTKETIADGSIWDILPNRYESAPHIWCGNGSAVWLDDALRINGFDNRFGVCGCDYNFGLRLAQVVPSWRHFCWQGRYFHLWHEAPWAADPNDFRSGDKKSANDLARIWATENAVTPDGIAQLNKNEFSVWRNLCPIKSPS